MSEKKYAIEAEKEILDTITNMLMADEPIKCSDPDCRELHLSNNIGYIVDGKELNIKIEWSAEQGRYIMFREDEDDKR